MNATQPTPGPESPRPFPSLAEFESGDVDPKAFIHAAHVFVAWNLLDQCTLVEAIQRYTTALRRLTKAFGQETKYHETMTCFFILLIAERRSDSMTSNWQDFIATNPDLLTDSKAILHRFYSDERLCTALARKQFLLPDRNGAA